MGSLPVTFQRASFDLLADQDASTGDRIRCLPDLIHHNAVHNPDNLFCIQNKSSTGAAGKSESIEVTFLELEHAVERCCEWILSNVSGTRSAELADDGSVQKSRPVAVFLESDLTLFLYLTALLTLNIPCLLLSIRLNTEAVEHLLNKVGSESVIVSARTSSKVENAVHESNGSSAGIQLSTAATFETFLSASMSTMPVPSRVRDCRQMVREGDRKVIYLHSSGTTGLPKPVPLTHRYLLAYAGCHEFPVTEDLSKRGCNLSTLPLYHGFGTLAPSLALSVGKPVWFPQSSTIPNASLVISMLKVGRGRITSLMTVPAILEDMTVTAKLLSDATGELAKLDFVAVGGGGIKATVGSKLASNGVTLVNHFGATELGALAPIFQPNDDYDWRYLKLRKDLGLRLEPVENKGSDREGPRCKLIGHPFAWDEEFELQDDLEANPRKPQTEVKILGRNDDTIILATGENVVPHPLERFLEQHPDVRRAILFGHGQFEVGVLIEPHLDNTASPEIFVDEIWSDVQEANALMDTHARVASKTAVLVKPAHKDIPLTDKGSVARKQVYSVFESEISEVYSLLANADASNLTVPIDTQDPKQGLRDMAQSCLPEDRKSKPWDDESDFVALGMDSLQLTRFRRTLQTSLRSSGHPTAAASELPPDFIYSNPSILSLAESLVTWLGGATLGSDPAEKMMSLVDKHAYKGEKSASKSAGSTVLLTGTTGNLGANLIHMACEDERTDRVICLLRLPSGQETASLQADLAARQQKALRDRDIILSDKAWSKIEFLPWSPGADRLGLSEDQFVRLSSRVTHIFHGAWPMDFKVKVQSLEAQVIAVRELLRLANLAHASRPSVRPRFVLASSIAVVGCFPSRNQLSMVPETIVDDPRTALPIGYAEAKWVCEKVMESAYSYSCEVEPVIVRIGQLSGSKSTGFWSSKEHFPALVKASQTIGALPDLQGSLSWIPVDEAAQTVMDILLGSGPRELVYHLENPTRQPWSTMCTTIEQSISLPSNRRLPFSLWLERFAAAKDSSQDLVEFFQTHFLNMSSGSLVLDTTKARGISSTLRLTGAVNERAVRSYLDFWKSIGFLK